MYFHYDEALIVLANNQKPHQQTITTAMPRVEFDRALTQSAKACRNGFTHAGGMVTAACQE